MEEIKKVEESLDIVVDDGTVLVPVKNTFGEMVGEFRFRPTDFNIVKRYNEVAQKFGEVVKPLVDANIDTNGEGADEESMKILNEVEAELFKLVDYLFDGNMAQAFFGKMHAFSPVDGKFYCENALEAVGQFISRKFDEETKQISSRVDKYTHGYRTGKHKDGKK